MKMGAKDIRAEGYCSPGSSCGMVGCEDRRAYSSTLSGATSTISPASSTILYHLRPATRLMMAIRIMTGRPMTMPNRM